MTITRNGARIVLLGLAPLLAGCAVPAAQEAPPSNVDARIASAVERASNANVAIAEVEVATTQPVRPGPGATVPRGVVLPPEAVQPISVDWNGPVEEFLEAIARRAGYSFRTTGRAPATGVMVSIRATEEPLYGVVRRAGNMIHGHGDIAFNPSSRSIELRYGS